MNINTLVTDPTISDSLYKTFKVYVYIDNTSVTQKAFDMPSSGCITEKMIKSDLIDNKKNNLLLG